MKKGMKKVLALLLASVMIMALASCGGGGSSSTEPAGTTGAPSKSESNQTEPAKTEPAQTEEGSSENGSGETAEFGTWQEIISRDYSKKLTIEYAGPQLTDGVDFNHGSEYTDWWSTTFNTEWDATVLTFENWTQRLNTWINADDLPDWCVWNFNAGDANNYVEQGLFRKFPDDWKERWPNVAASQELCPLAKWCEEKYGGTYIIFRPVFANNYPADVIVGHMSVYLRTDWAEKAGYDLSKNIASNTITLDEFIAYNQAVKDAGITEYPFYGSTSVYTSMIDSVAEATGTGQVAFYKGSDGKYHWGPAEEETGVKEAVRKLKKMYDNGLVYPDFYSIVNYDYIPYFNASGVAASYAGEGIAARGDANARSMKENLNLDYWKCAIQLILVDDNGVNHGDPSTNYWACNILSPDMDDEKFERLMDIWDFSCTDYGQLCVRMGVPKKDWDYDKDGNPVNLLAGTPDESVSVKYANGQAPVIYGNMVILSDDFSFANPAFDERARKRVVELYKTRAQITSVRGEEVDWDFLGYSSQALNLATMTYGDEYANIITKAGDFDENYDQWVKDKMALIQPVLDDLNEKFAK